MKRKFVIATLGALLSSAAARAESITYTFDGQFSGSLAGNEFNLANVVFSLTSDTDTVFQPTPAVRPTLFNSGSGTLTFSINGTTGTFDALYNAFSITLRNGQSLVGLTETGSNELIDVVDRSLFGYDLRSSIGPVTNSPLDFLNFDTVFATSLGDLVLFDDDDASVTFSAQLAGAVPEPATWGMMFGGVGMAGGALRRRKATASICYA